jgi:NAD-reducing hydrogenase large subunit
VVKIDYFLPGCPPRADLIWAALVALLGARPLALPYELQIRLTVGTERTMTRKITIDPVTRVEGHGKVTIHLDDEGNVAQSRLHIVEFRGFERFVQGRPYWEAPVLVQRLCGICPVSHHLAAAKAMDVVVGAGTGAGLTPTAEKMRRLMHYGQIFQSHALHFFHLASPGPAVRLRRRPGDPQRDRRGAGEPRAGDAGVLMRKYGQEVIKATAGKKIHGTGAIPGGVNKNLSPRSATAAQGRRGGPLNADQMIAWSQGALAFFKDYYREEQGFHRRLLAVPSNHLSLVRKDGALDLYHGVLRAVDADGKRILDDVDYQDYLDYMARRGAKSWSYMKFPYLKRWAGEGLVPGRAAGPPQHLRLHPDAAGAGRIRGVQGLHGRQAQRHVHAYHWARLIEVLHAAEVMRDLLNDPDLQGPTWWVKGRAAGEGVGLIEAPARHAVPPLPVDEDDLMTMAT